MGIGPSKSLTQNYWDIIGKDIVKTCLGVLNEVENVGPLNKLKLTYL